MVEVYNSNSKDEKNLANSSSGGMYFEFARYIINDKNGIVYGVSFDKEILIGKYVKATKINEINTLLQSKYCKVDLSNLKELFIDIKQLLDNNKIVLFSCLPCIGMALKTFLKKEYDNLYFYCLICSGYNIDILLLIKDLKEKLLIEDTYTVLDLLFRFNKQFFYILFKNSKSGHVIEYKSPYWSNYVLKFLDILKKCRPCLYSNIYDTGKFDICAGDMRSNLNRNNNKLKSRLIINKHGIELFNLIKKYIDYEKIDEPNQYYFKW